MEVPNRTLATENDVVVSWAALYLPDLQLGSITINATVPEYTPENSVYIYGSFQEWIVTNALRMEMVSKTQYTITIDNATQFNYKLLAGKNTQYVEVSTSGADINLYETNRSIGFSDSKAYESWFRVIVRHDESVLQATASSNFFRVKRSDGMLVLMERTMDDGVFINRNIINSLVYVTIIM